jgi:hypothetical protein
MENRNALDRLKVQNIGDKRVGGSIHTALALSLNVSLEQRLQLEISNVMIFRDDRDTNSLLIIYQ